MTSAKDVSKPARGRWKRAERGPLGLRLDRAVVGRQWGLYERIDYEKRAISYGKISCIY
jgi:hypothetical protein